MPPQSNQPSDNVVAQASEPGPLPRLHRMRRVLEVMRQPRHTVVLVGGLFVLSSFSVVLAMHSVRPVTPKVVANGVVLNKTTTQSAANTSGTSSTTRSPATSPAASSTKSPTKTTSSNATTAEGLSTTGGPTITTSSAPAGKVFALLDPGESSSNMQAYASKASVDGLAFRAMWSSLEPTNGTYNWTSIDAALTAAASNNKQVTVHIAATSGGTPSWLTGLGMKTYTYSTPSGARTDPIPWDSVYIQHYNQFVAALGQHISATGKMPVVDAASVGTPVSEMTIVGCANSLLTGGTPYNRTTYSNTWKSTIAATAAAYAGKKILVSLPIGFICQNDGNDGKSFMTELFNAVKSTAPVSYYAADLDAAGSTRLAQADTSLKSSLGINFQTIWSYTNDPQHKMQGNLSTAVCYGWNAGSRYIEIYKSDLDSSDPNVASAIVQARTGSGC